MELHLLRKRKWIVAMALLGVSTYTTYKLYHFPSVTKKRKKLFKLFSVLISLAETISDSSDVISIVSRDLKQFLQSDTDEIPKSLKQLSKIAHSNEFSESVATVTEAVSLGFLKFYQRKDSIETEHNSSLSDRFMDKIMSTAGTGFVSVIVGNFAKNLVQGLLNVESSSSDFPKWLNLAISNEKCRPIILDCIQTFVSSAVAVYLDKTTTINVYDELFSSITDPKHQTEVKDLLVSICKGSVETLVKTVHQVMLTSSRSDSVKFIESKEPINQEFVFDLMGRITSETVRSVLEFVSWKLNDGLRRRVVENGLEVVRFVDAKSSVIVTVCIALYLHALGNNNTRLLMSI
ncbi:protein PHLOEM PROTEIN 2-LIKE A10-like [Impatiens glandulifera]|uniref:protein PHLOEM PROTEIN 2-LIKE A10-like n=1 Tax=Impatiens glandulifera TaxID=253017 RepID=UPI001FB15A4C|nr:protein PHLOEM PROTEIN 2-LIKE A10-like [Impatiens glandulifera]XP_047323069.1 protein PHLOEM PROTEIN 2-LIKE A10-like [Impatiens glandulifera]